MRHTLERLEAKIIIYVAQYFSFRGILCTRFLSSVSFQLLHYCNLSVFPFTRHDWTGHKPWFWTSSSVESAQHHCSATDCGSDCCCFTYMLCNSCSKHKAGMHNVIIGFSSIPFSFDAPLNIDYRLHSQVPSKVQSTVYTWQWGVWRYPHALTVYCWSWSDLLFE